MKRVLVVGATSKIAQEVLKCFAATGAELFLSGRDRAKLNAISADLMVRGAGKIAASVLDLNDVGLHPQLLQEAVSYLGGLDIVLIAYGTLSDQAICQRDVNLTLHELNTNFISVVSLLTMFANYFEDNQRGCLAVISSVAGDRGRQSNYVYGAAKGALTIFLQGLRNRLFKVGVAVITIKPGLVDTPMTSSLAKNFLFADPTVVGRQVFGAIEKRRRIVYVPWFWRWIMLVIRLIPEGLFMRTHF